MDQSFYPKIAKSIIDKNTFKDYPNGYVFYDDRNQWWKGHQVNKLEELQKFFPHWCKIVGAKGLIEIRDKNLNIKGELEIEYDEKLHEVSYETVKN